VNYLRAVGLNKGYLVIFDEQLSNNPLVAASGSVFEWRMAENVVRVYVIGITV
jgi:hypothetical protein